MTVQYKRNSNYRNTEISNGELGAYQPPITVDYSQTTQMEITQKYDRRPDKLAYDLYGDAKMWWIFLLYNRNQILDPIHDFTIGLTIFVPNRDYVAGL